MFYVYVLKSKRYNEVYIGSTNDLQRRFSEHNNGKEISTKRYMPWFLVYYEAFLEEKLARERESRLKHNGNARHELYQRIGLKKSGLPSTTFCTKSGAGFTLIELLLSITIISLIMLVAVPNFREGARQTELSSGAREIVAQAQNIQTMSVAGKTTGFCEGQGFETKICQNIDDCCSTDCARVSCRAQVPAGGYGLRWEIRNPRQILVFADKNNNHLLDTGKELINYPISFSVNLVLDGLFLIINNTSTAEDALDVVFEPPSGRIYLNGQDSGQAKIVLKHKQSGKTKTIIFDAVSGRMEIE